MTIYIINSEDLDFSSNARLGEVISANNFKEITEKELDLFEKIIDVETINIICGEDTCNTVVTSINKDAGYYIDDYVGISLLCSKCKAKRNGEQGVNDIEYLNEVD